MEAVLAVVGKAEPNPDGAGAGVEDVPPKVDATAVPGASRVPPNPNVTSPLDDCRAVVIVAAGAAEADRVVGVGLGVFETRGGQTADTRNGLDV